MDSSEQIFLQINNYSQLVTGGLYLIVIGMFAIFVLHKIVTRFLYPLLMNKTLRRIVKVAIGSLYVLVLVVTVLLALNQLGYDVSVISKMALLITVLGAVIAFFIVPFLPSFPFKIGNMVTINGTTGIVDSVTTYHTLIRTFDGKMTFIPNTKILGSDLVNYHYTPNRRVDFMVDVSSQSDLEKSKALLLKTITANSMVLTDPAPDVFITDANGTRVEIFAFCWVENANWFGVRSDLWVELVKAFKDDPSVSLSLPKQEVILSGDVPN